jgi:hypothetical protein
MEEVYRQRFGFNCFSGPDHHNERNTGAVDGPGMSTVEAGPRFVFFAQGVTLAENIIARTFVAGSGGTEKLLGD